MYLSPTISSKKHTVEGSYHYLQQSWEPGKWEEVTWIKLKSSLNHKGTKVNYGALLAGLEIGTLTNGKVYSFLKKIKI